MNINTSNLSQSDFIQSDPEKINDNPWCEDFVLNIPEFNPEEAKRRIIAAQQSLRAQETQDNITASETPEEPYIAPNFMEKKSQKNIHEIITILSNLEIERTGEIAIRPRAEFICDHDHIENQRVNIINKKDLDIIEFNFKLRNSAGIIKRTKNEETNTEPIFTTNTGTTLQRGEFLYQGAFSDKTNPLCDAFLFEKSGLKIFIADPTSKQGQKFNQGDGHIKTADGLVRVEAPIDMDAITMQKILSKIMQEDFDIPDALSPVSEQSMEEYKIARYKWQYNIANQLTPEQTETAKNLEYAEVFPGYTTLIEKGKHQEYLTKYGKAIRAVHYIKNKDVESIYHILTKGLMSTTERYSRGVIRSGHSSDSDMNTGGADSVFTRILENPDNNITRGINSGSYMIVLKPEIFDRTDWYSYSEDRFGSTDKRVFWRRLSPDEILSKITTEHYCLLNEQMFRIGIGANYIESIRVGGSQSRQEIITKLQSMGLEKVGDKSLEEIIILNKEAEEAENAIKKELEMKELERQKQKIKDLEEKKAEAEKLKKQKQEEEKANRAKLEAEKLEKQKQEEEYQRHKEELAIKKKAMLAKTQALINGEIPYTSLDDIVDLASYVGDNNFISTFESIVEGIIKHGEKERLKLDVIDLLKNDSDMLRMLMTDNLDGEDKQLLLYLQKTLNIDYETLYKEIAT